MKTVVRHTVCTVTMVAIVAAMALADPTTASAYEYTDEDAGYIQVAARVVQPVGILLEAIVFKPFTALMAWGDSQSAREARRLHPRECFSSRPHRGCVPNPQF